jgi:serine/threonine-protein kinase HipA
MPAEKLDVYYEMALIGSLFDTDPLSFEYAGRWIGRSDAFALPGIPLAPGPVATEAVAAVFDNLLPEGALREYIGKQKHVSTIFALLREVAGDTAGGLCILEAGTKQSPPSYEKLGWADLAALLAGKKTAAAIDLNVGDARISLSGAQDKVLIAIDDTGEPMLPGGESPSTHILKPDIKRLPKVHHSAVNETVAMLAAGKAGLQVAEVFYEPITGACIVKRFDRVPGKAGLTRLLQYDLCQLNGTLSDRKYESEGGPGIERCAALIKEFSARPAVDLLRLLEWVFFNLYVGNNDSHAKNLSIYFHPHDGAVLTPFYDLMCTRVYPGLSAKFALSVGGEYRPGNIGRDHVIRMAEALGFRPAYVLEVAAALAGKIAPAFEAAIEEAGPALTPSGRAFAQKLQWEILRIAKKNSGRILG